MKKNIRLNISLITGLLFGAGVILFAVFESTGTPWIFINVVAFLIVYGGVTSAALSMYSVEDMKDLALVIRACFFKGQVSAIVALEELVKISEKSLTDRLFYNADFSWLQHSMIRDGLDLIEMGYPREEIKRRLEVIAELSLERYLRHSGMMMSLSKMGPSFGLLGTVVGLVVMLKDLGGANGIDHVGPSLAISLLATLYGVVSASLLFQPISELLRHRGESNRRVDGAIIEGICLLRERTHPVQVRDSLKTYLTWAELQELRKTEPALHAAGKQRAA